uniref:Acetyl-coenzyme A carboxylase carboxyl transferase subunit beta, chloroplastic n=1 Tax=Doona zeylanica TaxID=365556 RepID=A0A3Q9TZZ5_9ROSI|nr:acetyl-CoA carboxylase carboxyltransferase beta subunit [Doona zeylanica]AZZ06556.1 acetyl-CoA carboxylase carboxyltransferase beta subunit [Doona zeylanica]
MEKSWFNSKLAKKELEYRCGLSKSMDSLGPLEHPSGVSEDPVRKDTDKNWSSSGSSSYYGNVDNLIDVKNIRNFISDYTLLIRDSNRDSYSIYFDIENQIFEIDNDHSWLSSSFYSFLSSSFYSYRNPSYMNNISKSDDPHYDPYLYDSNYSWNNHINSCIDSYLRSQIRDITEKSSSPFEKYRHLWVLCENCYTNNYKRLCKSKMYICEECGYHLKMSSSDRIELSIDPGTWAPMDEDMIPMDLVEFHSEEEADFEEDRLFFGPLSTDFEEEADSEEKSDSETDRLSDSEEEADSEEESYKDRIDSYQRNTGLTEAVQTGTGQLNGIPIAIGVMDFEFIGGSMGSVVGEKITRLIEYATNKSLPLILVCASGGARMQEGSLSLMQMAKISSALYDYQSNKKLFYISILTSPTTGGVTASFGMLGDIIIAEPNAYIAFAGKRVIEETLKKPVPEGSQETEYLFPMGLFDLIVPRTLLKVVLGELFQLHGFLSYQEDEK